MNDFKLLINGKLVNGDQVMTVVNPATEEPLAECPRGSAAQLDAAVAAAKSAYPAWSAKSINERRAVINQMADVIEANGSELARTLTQEQGKPLADAIAEVANMAAYFRYFATLDLPIEIVENNSERKIELHRKSLGVVGAIIPWNFPLFLIAFKLPPALMAGNTIVIKPSPTTPLATLQFAALIAHLVPPGVVNVITDMNDLGSQLTAHPDVAKISFTGSSETGKKVMGSVSSTLKRITLELGGNDAGIVLADADPKKIAPAIFESAFQNSGQVCLALKRLYVHESIYDEMCSELAVIADATIVDNGLKQGTKLGPLQNKMQYEKVQTFLRDAHENGTIIAGGEVVDGPGYFIRPTIVRDIEDGSMLVDKEQFGPILPLIKFSDESDAIRRANASSFGLGGSVWSSDIARAHHVAVQMEAGTIWVNKHLEVLPYVPFGGAKNSGIGSELGVEGLHEYTQLQVVNIAM